MTTQEFSNEFDVLYNNIMSNQAPGLNEYEKSVFLTKAQYEIVKNYCNPKGNKYQEGVDGNPKRQIDFSTLLRVANLSKIELPSNFNKFDERSIPFIYPKEAWISINEAIVDSSKKQYQIVPLAYNEYSRLMNKPYKYPLKNQAWRLFNRIDIPEEVYYDSSTFNSGDTQSLLFRAYNYSDKQVRITLRATDEATLKTNAIIRENTNFIEIIIDIPFNTPSYSWFSKHLVLGGSYYQKEIIDITGEWGGIEGESSFPAFTPTGSGTIIYTTINIKPLRHTSKDTLCEIIGNFNTNINYRVRYFKKPTPIILEDLTNDSLMIDGVSEVSECILPEELHPEILQRAVELAKAAYQGDINSITQMGQRSE